MTSRSSIQPFICEISDPSIRGTTSTLWALFFSSGQALSILASNQLGWREVSAFFAALMFFCVLVLMWIHETPDWLLEKCQFEKAIKALEFYKIDPKILVDDDQKRKSSDGKEKSYSDIVEMYRKESEAAKSKVSEDEKTHNDWR